MRTREDSVDSAAPVLAVRGLTAGYDRVPVVKDVALTVNAGEVVALLGSNGAGKTTTLSAIAGLVRPMAGTVKLLGVDVAGLAAHKLARRGVALVPEDRSLFHSLTSRENLKVARRGRSERDDEALDLLPELRKCLDRKSGLLSGGEQQMLAVGRAVVSKPRVLIVDEMSLGLAPVVVERLLPVLRTLADSHGTAVLVVEQHVALALDVATRAYVMAQGRVIVSGRTDDLGKRRDLFLACYLGDLNAAAELSALAGTSASNSHSPSELASPNP